MNQPSDPLKKTSPQISSPQTKSTGLESQFATQGAPNNAPESIPGSVPQQMGHYEIQVVLGSGGMGQVFKAFDSKLKRFVALKLLRGETPELTRRFAQEARVQAKIEHENVCKVYEVGEADGKPFIAMQFIPGKTLKGAAKELKLEEKIRLLKEVAEALHASHREGLIHRDIKPTNIMVVRTEEGRWKPYVMDFGLAREQETAGLTMSGVVMGTPHYMAPEQARGETSRLDRRTDIYSLGATMYELLSGQTPFQGNSTPQVMIKVLQEDPLPLRRLDSSIPLDLETIVMKCMEKEQQRRYESAKALAEDLQRYLDGDPIAARPVRWSERLVKKARKNKVATAILGGALVTTLVLLGTLIWVQTKSSVQARYAREFGEEVRGIQSMMGSVYSAPLHDIRGELDVARKRLAKIENRTREAGTWAYGPGHNALGLGYFALDDYERALQNLNMAWQSDYREASTAYALGKTLGMLYQRALREAELIKNKALRAEQTGKIEKDLRDPAVAYLKMSRASIDSPAYADGLIAFYEKRYSDALKKSIEAYKQAAWSYDAKKLQGDLYLQIGKELENKGEYEKSAKNYESAGQAYRTAIELRRSRAEIYLSEADRWTSILNRDAEKGVSNEAALNGALMFADHAIAINSDAPEGYARKAKVYTTAGTYLMYNTGDDPRKLMEQAIAMAQEVLKRNQNDPAAFDQTGTAYRLTGEYETRHGLDPRKALALSIENNQKSLQFKPDNPSALVSGGVAYSLLGEYELKHGKDPRATFRKAIQQYRTSQQIRPNYLPPYTNAGIAYWYVAQYELNRGIDPGPSFRDSIQQYQSVIQRNPNDAFAHFNLGLVYLDAGRYEMRVGRDPSTSLNLCLQAVQKSSEGMNNAYVPSGFGSVYSEMAQYQLDLGKDPTSLLGLARASLQKSIEIDPSNYEPYGFLGRVETVAARYAMKTGQSPDRYFQAARKAFKKSIELNEQEAGVFQMMGYLYRWEAEWKQAEKRSAAQSIANGLVSVQKVLSFNAEDPEGFALQGALYLLQAQEQKNPSAQLESARRAQISLKKALKINRWLEREYSPLLKKASSLSTAP